MLTINNIEVVYSNVILVLKGLSLEVPDGRIVALLGGNGAGKTTTLKAISGILKAEDGRVSRGIIDFNGEKLDSKNPEKAVKMGIVQVPEGRRVFAYLTVEENLRVGGHTRENVSDVRKDLDTIYGYFPQLGNLRHRTSGYLSGGEQQMLAFARGLMASPTLMLWDEPSLGLSPLVTHEIFQIAKKVNLERGVSILLVEQNAKAALSIAHYGYVMELGKVVLEGLPDKLSADEDVKEFYLGMNTAGQQKSYRDVKHYRRRKRWLA